MPILIPAGGISASRHSSVALMTVAAVGCVEHTPWVDCTVSAVMQAVPKSECAAKTIKSAVTPAPDEGSKPAMVRTVCMGCGVGIVLSSTLLKKMYQRANQAVALSHPTQIRGQKSIGREVYRA